MRTSSANIFSFPMSPVHLPLEILSEIFRMARPRRQPSHLLPFEVVLSHVSLEWRNAIISDSTIWSTINIYSPKSIARAKAYLVRSGSTAPLYLRVEVYDYDHLVGNTPHKRDFIESVKTFVASCMERCKTLLIFTYRESTCCALALGLKHLAAPRLERLRINTIPWEEETDLDDEDEDEDDVPDSLFTSTTPPLRFLEIEGLQMYPPLGNIVTLHLHEIKRQSFTVAKFQNLVKAAPRLQNLSLHFTFWGFPQSWSGLDLSGSPIVTLKALKALRVQQERPGTLTSLLLAINAPKLESLWLSPSNSDTNFDYLFDSPQFSGSNHKFSGVKYLTLDESSLRIPGKWNKVFPNVEHFYLHIAPVRYASDHWFGDAFSSNPPLWPKLQTLAYDTKSARPTVKHQEQLTRIVSSRLEMRVGLKMFLSDADFLISLGNKSRTF
ncbi:hypothetical protein BKA70DRAFT_648416 [Coprinopsis sp. MPI-PUGE-AT-0042]|nr:hypothetical protein BKA70DRAFT_648416 [Coprinopsis sp. MPI-PUGE-AT-0042]